MEILKKFERTRVLLRPLMKLVPWHSPKFIRTRHTTMQQIEKPSYDHIHMAITARKSTGINTGLRLDVLQTSRTFPGSRIDVDTHGVCGYKATQNSTRDSLPF